MKAFFADIKETGLVPDRGTGAWGAQLALPSDAQKLQLATLAAKLAAAQGATRRGGRQDAARRRRARGRRSEGAMGGRRAGVELAASGCRTRGQRRQADHLYDEPVESNFYLDGSLEHRQQTGRRPRRRQRPESRSRNVHRDAESRAPARGRSSGSRSCRTKACPAHAIARGADRFLLSEVEAELAEAGGAPRKLSFVATVNDAPPGSFSTTDPGMPPMAAIDSDPRPAGASAFGEARNPFLALRFARAGRRPPPTRRLSSRCGRNRHCGAP